MQYSENPDQAGGKIDRRDFCLGAGGAIASGAVTGRSEAQPRRPARKRVAALVSEYRLRSHAQHIIDRFLQGYPVDGEFHDPPFEVVSLYTDQVPSNDLSRERARTYKIRLCGTVEEALTLGTDTLAVDAVLNIFEHGKYPHNEKGQHLLPRYEHFKRIVDVFERTGRTAPVFNDKHLSHDWERARWMYDQSKKLGFALMAGSSLPVTWRHPALEFPLGVELEEVLCAAHGGIDSYDFHALEVIQCMAERRAGGETGLRSVQCLEGDAVWEAGRRGAWSPALLQAALARSDTRKSMKSGYLLSHPKEERLAQLGAKPVAFLLEYRDGLRGTMLLLSGVVEEFLFAAKVRGQSKPASAQFYLPYQGHVNFFSCLVKQIERMFETGKAPWPAERTLLTTGMLAFALESRHRGHARLQTPQLGIRYRPPEESFFCRE